MKKSILLPIITIALAAAILLGLSFGLNGIANANAQKEHLQTMKWLVPGSENFTVEPYDGEDAIIRSVHKGETGFVIETVTRGYAADIVMLIGVSNEGKASTRLGMFGWPALGEELEIYRDIELCRLTGCPLHIAHISTEKGLNLVRAAKAEGLPVTCEVTPHHLFLNEDDIDSTYNTNLKMNPPLRLKSDMLALRKGIVDGSIDCLVTDHAPHAQHEKDCEWEIAFFGTIGLETSLPLMLTNMVRTGEISWSRLVEVMAVNPRRVLRLADVKIEKGSKADLTLLDPEKELTVTEAYFERKSKNTAFLGETLMGVASDVFVDGKRTLANGVVAQ